MRRNLRYEKEYPFKSGGKLCKGMSNKKSIFTKKIGLLYTLPKRRKIRLLELPLFGILQIY